MDVSFGPETPVLWYAPRAHANPGPRNERVYLLWPAWAHRVLAPEVRRRTLNPLALTVLRLYHAARLTAAEVAVHLGVRWELAAYVTADLQGSGYLDDNWAVTERGRELIDDETEVATKLVPGWVFRDPWSERLWPFVAREWSPAETTINDRGFPVLQLGTTGKPWVQSAHLQRADSRAAPKAPETREILRVAREQQRIDRRLARGGGFAFDDELDTFDPQRLDLNRIIEIEPDAHPVYLTTFLYVPHDGADQELDWHVCDFFGRENCLELRRQVIKVAEREPHLAHQVDRVIGRTLLSKDWDDYLQRQRQRRSKAQVALDVVLSIDVRRHPIHAALVELLDAWLEWREVDKHAGEQGDVRKRKAVLLECRTVLEGLFVELRKTHSLKGIWKPVEQHDAVLRKARYLSAAKSVGFSGLPDALESISKNHIKSVADYDNGHRLRPLLMATILGAARNPDHPLRAAAAAMPELLEKLNAVAELAGGEAAHYGTGSTIVAEQKVHSAVDDTLRIVGSLIGLPVHSIMEIE